ncbi:hypothetical protein [Paraburkholderia adhaesiva]|uniref:hypothetical protein n=1 Tax=Paraburkholderia adhaesiva TaxID=2883244 RepID=UPI001F335DCE|nr:hypothetical protein [Paraburkholderia adhaesiva]
MKANPSTTYFIRLDTATGIATRAADDSRLPQTIFRTPDTAGWTHTNSLARILDSRHCEVFVTILPRHYFP